jgi:hypothetical protein
VIVVAVWWYQRYGLSYRDIEELLAGRVCLSRTAELPTTVTAYHAELRSLVLGSPSVLRRPYPVETKPKVEFGL